MRRIATALLTSILLTTSVFADSIITGSKPFTFTPGTTISSSQVNADYDYIINQVNANAAKNGVNSSITALLGLTTPIAVSGGGSPIWTATTIGGTANAVTVTATTPIISSYSLTKGNIVSLQATATNTGTATLNVNSLGATAIVRPTQSGLIALIGGEIQSGQVYNVYYDGTQYILLNPIDSFGTATNLTAAATTDLGTIVSHTVVVTGNTGITSFGSSASTALPLYYVRFTGTPTITYNATSLILPNSQTTVGMNAGDALIAEYLGSSNWRVIQFLFTNTFYSALTANGLTITNNAGTPTTQLDITTTGASVLQTTTFASRLVSPVTQTLNAATTGANGLDTGALAANTWYYVYLIDTGTTTSTLLSLSATAPTMPTGYVFKMRIGAVRTGGSSTFLRTIQKGNVARYQVVAASTTPNLPIMANSAGPTGSVTVPTWVSVATGTFVPTTAVRIIGIAMNGSAGSPKTIVAPNNAYGAVDSRTNPPPVNLDNPSTSTIYGLFDFVLESTNIFWASDTTGGTLAAQGWVDAVNAN